MVLAFFACDGGASAVAGQIGAVKHAAAEVTGDRTAVQGNSLPGAPPAAATAPLGEPALAQAHAYLFRGALGLIFSRGMDKLAAKIQRAGIITNVYEFTICHLITATAIEDYKSKPFPIVLIGHSMGGRCALEFSEKLKDEGIPVSLVVTIDPAHLSPDVPNNVDRFINIFLAKDVLGGGDIKPAQDFRGHYASYDLSRRDEVLHINIDKMDAVHQQLTAKVVEAVGSPAKTEGETVPLRYTVPPKTVIELWDSGMWVTARPGDTLQTIAAQYRLPTWALTQSNQVAEKASLVPGQRVVVPRHLAPPAAAEPISSKR